MIRRPIPLMGVLLVVPSLLYAHVLCGIDVLQNQGFKSLKGANVALITNHTGKNRTGKSTVDLLHKSQKVNLIAILSPEHGFRGTVGHGQGVLDNRDEKTGIPIYSLYGKTTKPTESMLAGVDTIVYDIQDIGTRFYTYITTMGQALEAAAEKNLRFVILDRPNPLRGDRFEGDVLDEEVRRFTGYFSIPVRYGLTIGELAHWMNIDRKLNVRLEIIKMKNWRRDYHYAATKLKFIPPSPNIPNMKSALCYPGIGCFEATNISVGRGTHQPFQIFGAPWLDAKALCAYLRQMNFPGVLFETMRYKPKRDLYQGVLCNGVRLIVTDRSRFRPFDIFVASFLFINKHHPNQFEPKWEEVKIVTGSDRLYQTVKTSGDLQSLLSQYAKTTTDFKSKISPFFLYK